ncbi:cation:proton antiporter [Streptococcus halichoeri]|uniref:cation:proton antiporter n=1 Tax=Streptococcus halichoeri TaxID=254785 RepID=UPI0013589A80|nr:sodium:proton antiporter [Streptococcus halichoeri]
MTISILMITFLISLILSNVINRIFPHLPLPAIQLLFGVLFGIFVRDIRITFDPELFLAFVIAPLNFREGQESDVISFIRSPRIVLYLILPTVFITTLVMGYGINYLLPVTFPLALCFAMGAALAPTDAVAFLSLANRFKFPKQVKNTLTSEGLLNDASGLVAFEFALAALMTGHFSMAQASWQLLVAIFGGVAIGLFFALLNRLVLSVLEKFDAADVTGALLLELMLPFVVYFVASLLNVSGIIAVVIAGVMQANKIRKVTLFDAQVDRVTTIIWRAIQFILNGLVFMIFGVELTQIMGPVLSSPHYSNLYLLILVLALTALLFFSRFVLLSLFFLIRSRSHHKPFRKYLHHLNLLTFSGVKGSVSIAIILLLPKLEALQHSLVFFTVGAVTLLSFLVGLLVLPRLAPLQTTTDNYFIKIAILTEVLQLLELEGREKPHNQAALYAVMDTYNRRIANLILEQEPNSVKEELAEIQLMILSIESEGLDHALRAKEMTLKEYRIYQRYLKTLEKQVNRSFVSSFTYALTIFLRVMRRLFREIRAFRPSVGLVLSHRQPQLTKENRERLTELYLTNTELILDTLEDLEGFYNTSLVNFLQHQRLQNAELIKSGLFVERVITNDVPDTAQERLHGYYLERYVIFDYEKQGEITAKEAQRFRDEVNELETYTLRDNTSPGFADLLQLHHF